MLQERKLIRGIAITVSREYNYAIFTPEADGIAVESTNRPPKKGFVMRREPSGGYIVIPKKIRVAYQMGNKVKVDIIDDAHFKILINCKDEKLPKFYAGFSYRGNLTQIPLDHVLESGTVSLKSAYRIYISDLIPKDWKYRKIRIHTGDCLRIEVECVNKASFRENLIEDKELRDEFGNRMQWYTGNTMTYFTKVKSQTDYLNIACPKFFREAAHIKVGSMFRWYKVEHKGKLAFIFAPEVVKCDFTEEKIEPAKEIPQKVTICKECNEEKGDIGDLLKEIRDVHMLMEQVVSSYTALKEENEDLKDKLKRLASILGGDTVHA